MAADPVSSCAGSAGPREVRVIVVRAIRGLTVTVPFDVAREAARRDNRRVNYRDQIATEAWIAARIENPL